MAYGFVKLSKERRNCVSVVIVVVHAIQIILGITVLVISADFKSTTKYIHSQDTGDIIKISTIITVFGSHLLLIHFIGLRICYKCLKEPYRKATKIIINIWIVTGLGMSIDGIVCASIAWKTAEKLMQKLKESLSRGIGQYLSDPTWKKIFNEMQQSLECCGVENFIDWHQKPWIHMEYLLENSETVLKYAEPDARVLPPVTPWSCCRISFKTPCFHDPMQQSHFKQVWTDPHESLPSIYHTGCLKVLSNPIEGTLFALVYLNVFIFLLQIVLVVLMRFLYTSARNAVLMGNSLATAPGWFIGRGDFKLRGHPLSEFIKSKRSHDVIADLSLRPDEATEFETEGDSSPLPTTALLPEEDNEESSVSEVEDNLLPNEPSPSEHKHHSSSKHRSYINDEFDEEIEEETSVEKMFVDYEDETTPSPSTFKHHKVKKHWKSAKRKLAESPYLNTEKLTKKFKNASEKAKSKLQKIHDDKVIPEISLPKFNVKKFTSKFSSRISPRKLSAENVLSTISSKGSRLELSSNESPLKPTAKHLSEFSPSQPLPKLGRRESSPMKLDRKEKLKENKSDVNHHVAREIKSENTHKHLKGDAEKVEEHPHETVGHHDNKQHVRRSSKGVQTVGSLHKATQMTHRK